MKTLAVILIVFGLSGCSIIGNLDEISTLEQYSHEGDAQHREVKDIDDHYDALSKVVANGHISDYKTQHDVEHAFGDPILKKDLGKGAQRWLYRYAIYRFAKDKVYLYFDQNGILTKWEKLPCPKLF